MLLSKSTEQCLAGDIGFLLEPLPNLRPHSLEGVDSCPPSADTRRTLTVSRPALSHPPQVWQLSQEALQAGVRLGYLVSNSIACDLSKLGLSMAKILDQLDWVELGLTLSQSFLGLLADLAMGEEPLAWRGRREVPPGHLGSGSGLIP